MPLSYTTITTMRNMQAHAKAAGIDQMSDDQIQAVISDVRKRRHARYLVAVDGSAGQLTASAAVPSLARAGPSARASCTATAA